MAPIVKGKAQAQIIDRFTGHAVNLLRFDAGVRAKLVGMLKELANTLAAEVVRADFNGPARQSYRQKRLKKLLDQSRATIATAYGDLSVKHAGMIGDLADVEQTFFAKTLNGVVGAEVATVAMTPGQLKSLAKSVLVLGAPSGEWWARQRASTTQKFIDVMRQGLLQGESVDDLVRRVRGRSVGRGVYEGGIIPVSTRQAEALVRTSVQAVAQDVRAQLIQDNRELLNGSVHISTLDAKTSEICMARSNLKWDLDLNPVGHDLPYAQAPLHWNCRSQVVPWVKSWEEISNGRIKAEIPDRKQASMDGQVPAAWDYERWLKSKPEEFQREVLGKGKYEIWKKKGLTLRQMVDQTGNPLTIKELKRLAS